MNPFGKYGAVWSSYTDPETYDQYKNNKLQLRAGWSAGFHISPHNSQTLYFGANYLAKSVDRGDTWKIISPDLTHDKKEWQVPNYDDAERSTATVYQTITKINESSLEAGVIWVGTDCGYVQLTMDGGAHWNNLTNNIKGLPEYTWVTSIESSKYSTGRAYATFDNHKNFDNAPYVYVTEDYGKTWNKITGNLPTKEPCYVIKEGLKNPDLLFFRNGIFTLDFNGSWKNLDKI